MIDIKVTSTIIKAASTIMKDIPLDGWVVNNCMIDIKATSSIIPKAIIDEMKLYITQCIDGVIVLDFSPMDVVVRVKGILIIINIS